MEAGTVPPLLPSGLGGLSVFHWFPLLQAQAAGLDHGLVPFPWNSTNFTAKRDAPNDGSWLRNEKKRFRDDLEPMKSPVRKRCRSCVPFAVAMLMGERKPEPGSRRP